MKSLIVDFHAGCISTLASTLTAAAFDVSIASFSAHHFVLTANGFRDLVLTERELTKLKRRLGLSRPLQKIIPISPRTKVMGRRLATPRAGEAVYDLAWVQFPPGLYRRVLASGIAKHVIVYVSHRMDLWLSDAKDREKFWAEFTADWVSNKISVVSSNTFDAEYIKYFTGMSPKVLEPRALYAQSKETVAGRRTEILLMPAGLPLASDALSQVLGISPAIVPLRSLYPSYSLDDLRAHSAAILIPYSVYSITLVELMEIGITLFIPSARWLIKNDLFNDVQLFPLYADEHQIRQFHPDSGASDGRGPNESDSEIRQMWANHSYWIGKPNVHIWDSPEELKSLLSSFLSKPRHDARAQVFDSLAWKNFLTEISASGSHAAGRS